MEGIQPNQQKFQMLNYLFYPHRSMSRRIRRPHPSGGGTPLPPTVSEAMELVNPMVGGAEAMDTV